MTTLDLVIAATTDDGYWSSGSGLVTTSPSDRIGNLGGGISAFGLFPIGATPITGTVNVAYITLKSSANTSAVVDLLISAEDTATPTVPTSVSDGDGRTITTATVAWNLTSGDSWITNGVYNSPSLVSIIQELVDSYGSLSGNIQIFIKDNGSATNINRTFRDYSQSSANVMILHIEFTSSNAAPTIAPNTADASTLPTLPTLEATATDAESDDVRYEFEISDRSDFATAGSNLADYYDPSSPSGIVHPNPTASLDWEGNQQVDDRLGQSFKGMGGILTSAAVMFGSDTSGLTAGYVFLRVYAHEGTFGSTSAPLNAVSAANTPTPDWMAESERIYIDNTRSTTPAWQVFSFSGANQIRLELDTPYMIIIQWAADDGTYDNTIRIQADTGLADAGSCYIDGDSANWGVRTDMDMSYRVYETSILIDAVSGTDAGFANTVTGGDTDPFNSAEKVSYTVQAADELLPATTYYWRARATDPSGSTMWSDWTAVRSFTTQSTTGIGQPTESDAAQSMAAIKTAVLGQAVETDASQVLTVVKTAVLGQAAETDAAQPSSITKTAVLGQVIEANVAQIVSAAKTAVMGQAIETNAAQPVSPSVSGSVQQTTEIDIAQLMTAVKTAVLGQAVEANAAQGVSLLAVGVVQQTIETDIAQPITATKTAVLGQVVESNVAQPNSAAKTAVLGQAAESDAGQSLSHLAAGVVQQTIETDIAQPISAVKTAVLGQVVESNVTQPNSAAKTAVLGQAAESDAAQSLSHLAAGVVQQTIETNIAQPISVVKTAVLGQVVEVDVAFSLSLLAGGGLQQTLEFDTAQPMTVMKTAVLGQAIETDTATRVSLLVVGNMQLALESDTAQPMTATKAVALGQAVETQMALQLITGLEIVQIYAALVLVNAQPGISLSSNPSPSVEALIG